MDQINGHSHHTAHPGGILTTHHTNKQSLLISERCSRAFTHCCKSTGAPFTFNTPVSNRSANSHLKMSNVKVVERQKPPKNDNISHKCLLAAGGRAAHALGRLLRTLHASCCSAVGVYVRYSATRRTDGRIHVVLVPREVSK